MQAYSSEASSVLRRDLTRLANFGANLADAHSCCILLPAHLPQTEGNGRTLELYGVHSLSNDIVAGTKISVENGLIGWVAKHHRSIHVSPFEQSSSALGIYHEEHQLKSFIGIPIPLPFLTGWNRESGISGVIACDSKKSFAFSKIQGKLLEDLSQEVAYTTKLLLHAMRSLSFESSWKDFLGRGEDLINALGASSVEVLRMRLTNFGVAEERLGTTRAIELFEQIYRLAQQSIPPHLPTYKLPNGDMVFVVDAMMTGFYENKINAICNHVAVDGVRLSFHFSRTALRGRSLTLEQLVGECGEAVVALRQVVG